jgi:hypothetical protein
MSNTSRRGFLKHAAIAAGAVGASRLIPGGSLLGSAQAAPGAEPPAVFIFYMRGGYNALFGSADSFLGSGAFGTTAAGVKRVGTSDLYVDNRTFGTFAPTTLQKMATIGCRHGISSHPTAQNNMVMDGPTSRLIKLASTLPGSTAAIRAAVVGNNMPAGTHKAINGISLQQIRDLSTTIAALGGSTDPDAPKRAIAANGITASEAMSKGKLDQNPVSGKSLSEGYPAASAQLRQAVTPLNYANVASAYGVMPNATGTVPTAIQNSTRMQILGAELMISAGANVVIAEQAGWDTHGDNNGNEVRNKIIDDGTMAALKVFTDRMLANTERNVVTVIMGDFSRSLPGSNHQANLSATVIGKYVKLGTTGRVTADVGLPAGTPSIDGLWAYIAAVAGATGTPFGNNPHNLVL